jgi:hypothetical protein
MTAVRRKLTIATRKTLSKPAGTVRRRKTASATVTTVSEDRLIRTLQQRLLETVSSSEEEGVLLSACRRSSCSGSGN